ncbi:MAG: VCBS repeat-containing protein [Acidobacteria bacterium]|nr:VCBS repeat-containing protein [Acidobacteriota bacterium]
MKIHALIISLFVAFACAAVEHTQAASAGALDSGFNAGGVVRENIGNDDFNIPVDFVIDDFGRFITLSRVAGPNGPQFLLMRFINNGSVDTAYGTNGRVLISIGDGSSTFTPQAIARQADGKLLVAGDAGSNVRVVRINENGSLDTKFGTLGLATGGLGFGTSIAIQTDGRILIGGYYFNSQQSRGNDFLAVRFNTNGSLDVSFAGNGRAEFPISPGTGSDTVRRIIVQPDGKVVMLGKASNQQAAVRLMSDGGFDSTFGSSGVRVLPLYTSSTNDELYDAGIDSQGRIVLVGSSRPNGQTVSLLRRMNSSGNLDSSFGTSGSVLENETFLNALAIDADDRTITCGTRSTPAPFPLTLSRFSIFGEQDGLYGYDGYARVTIGNEMNCQRVKLQDDGKAVTLGYATEGTPIKTLVLTRHVSEPTNTIFDFDGDGKTDISLFRPGPGQWWYLRSSDSGNRAFAFGESTDTIVPADLTGDGKTDLAFWRPTTGEWYVLRSEDSTFFAFPFGATGDIPSPADFDGDGIADSAVFRPSSSTWFVQRSSDNQVATTPFGTAGDKPVPADYDGDGKVDVAIFRPTGGSGAGEWWYLRSSDGANRAFAFGAFTDLTVPGDYTGDGKADIAYFRPSTGEWYVLRSEDSSFYAFPWGSVGDMPAPGDYDGDGKIDAAVFRPSNSNWFALRSTAGPLILQFGITGDRPVPNAFVR